MAMMLISFGLQTIMYRTKTKPSLPLLNKSLVTPKILLNNIPASKMIE